MTTTISMKHTFLLFFAALSIRTFVMFFVIQPHSFYKQADSTDYHHCALSLATGYGMHRIDNYTPIFWRTPGYPLYLAFFYYLFGVSSSEFDKNKTAQLAALWIQIILTSFIPLILFYLAFLLTNTHAIALLTAWIAVIHPGLILASTYLLTEGLALIFFYMFLFFTYKNCVYFKNHRGSYLSIIAAALSLSIYTWMRPMGEFIGYFTAILLLLGGIGSWKTTAKKAVLFLGLFFALLFPWYWRNHQLTGEWFFCPTIGNYLNCFSVPKILRRTLQKPLTDCHKIAQQTAGMAVHKKWLALRGTGLHVSPAACTAASLPIVMQYPWYFIHDWLTEVMKTTFDLYTYQIIPMLNNSYWYDPIEEFLPEKITACLYAHPMPWYLRLLCWLEFFGALLLWIGLIGGFLVFVMHPFYRLLKPVRILRQAQDERENNPSQSSKDELTRERDLYGPNFYTSLYLNTSSNHRLQHKGYNGQAEVNAALSSHSVRPDPSLDSGVNAALSSHSVRPELVEGYEPNKNINFIRRLWLLCIPMISIIIGMTGGFGYARLRLPAEPLLIILSLTFWFWLLHHKKDNT